MMAYPATRVTFSIDDPSLQKLYDAACRKCEGNLQMFGPHQVLVEGGGYEKIWLETQPMGGEMYAKRNMTAALNNQLLFIRHQREDGRLAPFRLWQMERWSRSSTNSRGSASPGLR